MRYSGAKLVDHLASAYVLGTLTASARRRFERLMHDRADVRMAVAAWESTLGHLAQSIAPVRPPARVWGAIDSRTRPARESSPATRRSSWWMPAGFGLGGVLTGALALFALFTVAPLLFISADQAAMRAGEKLPQSYVGLLTDDKGDGKLLVSSLRHGRTMTVKVIGPIKAPAQGRLVLWAVPADAPAFMLGTVPATGSSTSLLPDTSEKLLSKVRKLVVTVETVERPASPGAAVFSGNCAKLW